MSEILLHNIEVIPKKLSILIKHIDNFRIFNFSVLQKVWHKNPQNFGCDQKKSFAQKANYFLVI